MQRLSMFALAAIAVLALSGVGFKTKPAPPPAQTAKSQNYYWYSVFDGSYNDWESVAYEEWEMEIYYDCTVNTNPGGGTLIEEGYMDNDFPHDYPPLIYLYGHF